MLWTDIIQGNIQSNIGSSQHENYGKICHIKNNIRILPAIHEAAIEIWIKLNI